MAVWQTVLSVFGISRRARSAGSATGRPLPERAGVAVSPSVPQRRITLAEQFSKVSYFVETATGNALSAQRIHEGARERLDATELSLRRMLADIEDIMPLVPMKSLARVARPDAGAPVRLALAA